MFNGKWDLMDVCPVCRVFEGEQCTEFKVRAQIRSAKAEPHRGRKQLPSMTPRVRAPAKKTGPRWYPATFTGYGPCRICDAGQDEPCVGVRAMAPGSLGTPKREPHRGRTKARTTA